MKSYKQAKEKRQRNRDFKKCFCVTKHYLS